MSIPENYAILREVRLVSSRVKPAVRRASFCIEFVQYCEKVIR